MTEVIDLLFGMEHDYPQPWLYYACIRMATESSS